MKAAVALLLAIAFAGLTYMMPSPYQPNNDIEYRGFPVPWARWQTTYNWIPIIGPIFNVMSFAIDPVALALDIVFWFAITYMIMKVAWKEKHET